MKKILFAAGFLLSLAADGQSSSSLDSILNTERSFAALSKNTNSRNAFLQYLDDSSVTVVNKQFVTGRSSWQGRKADSSLLFWRPLFAGISRDGDMGFTSGPWEWTKNRDGEKPAAFGQYATVWRKDRAGNWKIAIDLGVFYPQADPRQMQPSSTPVEKARPEKSLSALKDLRASEMEYLSKLNSKGISFDPGFFAGDAHILRAMHWTFIGDTAFHRVPPSTSGLHFLLADAYVSSSGDLGYSYGKIEAASSNEKESPGSSWLHIWKLTDGKWKIVLDSIGE